MYTVSFIDDVVKQTTNKALVLISTSQNSVVQKELLAHALYSNKEKVSAVKIICLCFRSKKIELENYF
jgi:hypothetical protein